MNEAAPETEIPSGWRVGVHTSIAGSLAQSAERAHAVGCTAFQIFSTNPRMWKSRELAPEEISAMARLRREFDLRPLVIHANYLLNLASPAPGLRQRSIEAFRGEICRAVALRAEYLVLHPGSFRDGSAGEGIPTPAPPTPANLPPKLFPWPQVFSISSRPPSGGVSRIAPRIENTCGQGNSLGGSFAELRDILALLDGLPADCCLDTAHCFAAGMDIASPQGLAAMLAEVERTVGLERVRVIHANDSRSPLGSHRDWHEHIGRGGIGREGFRRIVNHPALREKVFILETPLEKPGDDRRNLRVIRSLRAPQRIKPQRKKQAKRHQYVVSRRFPRLRSGQAAPRDDHGKDYGAGTAVGASKRSKEPVGVLVGA